MGRIILLLLTLTISSCSAGEPLVGAWRDGANTFEFFQDGTFTAKEGNQSGTGTYTRLDDTRIKLEYGGVVGNLAGPVIVKIQLSGPELTMLKVGNPNNVERTFRQFESTDTATKTYLSKSEAQLTNIRIESTRTIQNIFTKGRMEQQRRSIDPSSYSADAIADWLNDDFGDQTFTTNVNGTGIYISSTGTPGEPDYTVTVRMPTGDGGVKPIHSRWGK